MAIIPGGVKVAGFISPSDTTDTYPVVDPIYGIGGYREVADITERDAITIPRRRAGMLVLTQNNFIVWQLNPDLVTWRPFGAGGGGATLRYPFIWQTEVLIAGLANLPTLTVWIEDAEALNFGFNTYMFGGATFNQVDQVVMKEEKDYTASYLVSSNTLRINFTEPKNGEIVYST